MLNEKWREAAKDRHLSADQISALYIMEGPTREHPQGGLVVISTFDGERYVKLSEEDYWAVQDFRREFVVRRVA